jgi:2-polyprenyl-6-methoxyphenol hydroxylase-like FAD-dependent oxidoreductase
MTIADDIGTTLMSGDGSLKVLIVGAGIAGLSLARALEQKGIIPQIVERQAAWNARGTGLFLPGNATRAFFELGLLPDIAKVAVPIRSQRILDPHGTELRSIDAEALWSPCGPCLALGHADMHSILLKALDGTSVEMSRSISSVHQHSVACDVTFDNGETERYDLVVGADGIRSRIRELAFPNVTPVYAGYVCWRFLAENTIGVESWTAMIGKGQTLLAEPISPSTVYVYADRSVGLRAAQQYSETTDLERLFSDFSGPIIRLLEPLARQSRVHFSHIETVPSGAWQNQRIVLIGDAAHASSPSMAQGAGLACEDAVLLAEILSRREDVGEALRIFVQRRERRVAWVQKQCAVRDRMRTLPTLVSSAMFRHLGAYIYKRSYAPLLAPI